MLICTTSASAYATSESAGWLLSPMTRRLCVSRPDLNFTCPSVAESVPSARRHRYSKKGFVVLGAPCNQFGKQEPGDDKQIKSFAAKQGAKFPLTAKLDVNGPNESELYTYLKSQQGGLLNKDVKWNFSK